MTIISPLAEKLRPKTLADVVGQQHLIGPNAPLTALIQSKTPTSIIFYGSPGTGKTTLANIVANDWQLPIGYFNAAIDAKAKLQKLVKEHPDQTFALILDEIHRLTAPIQDYLLPYLENGHILLLATTTANPIISIDPAIRSRCAMFEVKPVTANDIEQGLQRAYQKLSNEPLDHPDVLKTLSVAANGDVRVAINLLSTLFVMYQNHITVKQAEAYAGQNHLVFDKSSNFHYDTISALQKSIRGSDTDAALYYASALCLANDLKTLIRRLTVIAYEDIGLADPQTVCQAITAINSCENLGLPEARIPLANAIILLCTANHSNSAILAIDKAAKDAANNQAHPIPYHLRDTHYSGSQKIGHTGYIYPHNFSHDWTAQQYLPTDLMATTYYQPKENASEQKIGNRYAKLKTAQLNILNATP